MKKKKHISKFIVIFVIVSIFGFTALAMWVQLKSGVELSATLIGCFFGFCTGELWMLSSIKKAKIINDANHNGIPDEVDPFIESIESEGGFLPEEDNEYDIYSEMYNQGYQDALRVLEQNHNEGDGIG